MLILPEEMTAVRRELLQEILRVSEVGGIEALLESAMDSGEH